MLNSASISPAGPAGLIRVGARAPAVSVDYSELAATYDRTRSSPTEVQEFWIPRLLWMGDVAKGSRVLDVGCGTGRIAVPLSEAHRVVVVDASPEMLAIARSKGSRAEFLRADARRLPFVHGSFPVAIAVMVLHLLLDVREVLWEIARVAHRAVIATIDMSKRVPHAIDEAFPSLQGIDAARFPPIAEIEDACRKAGWRRVHREDVRRRVESTPTEFLERVRGKYLSTLTLLPPGEFEKGLLWLEKNLPRRGRYAYEHTVTFVVA